MIHANCHIREILPKDNPEIAKVIRAVLIEFGVPKIGSAYEDKSLDALSDYYSDKNEIYFIIEKENKIVGGAGIRQLDNYQGKTCELQKMYFLPEARGIGLGRFLIQLCLDKASSFGFENCYLETMPYMKAARKLYRKIGFQDMDTPMGDTGHYACKRWMIKKL